MRKCIKTSLENATKAVNYFTRIDEKIAPELPVTWMFIRPPWAYPGGVRKCLKECMLIKIEEGCNSDEVSSQLPSIATFWIFFSSQYFTEVLYNQVPQLTIGI